MQGGVGGSAPTASMIFRAAGVFGYDFRLPDEVAADAESSHDTASNFLRPFCTPSHTHRQFHSPCKQRSVCFPSLPLISTKGSLKQPWRNNWNCDDTTQPGTLALDAQRISASSQALLDRTSKPKGV